MPNYIISSKTAGRHSGNSIRQPGQINDTQHWKIERTATIIAIVHSLSDHTVRRVGGNGRGKHRLGNCLRLTSYKLASLCWRILPLEMIIMTLNLILHTPHLFASPSRVTKAWGLARVPHLVSFKLSKEHTGDSVVHFLIIPLLLPIGILDLRTGDSDVQFLVSSGGISSLEVLVLRTGDSDVHFLVSSGGSFF